MSFTVINDYKKTPVYNLSIGSISQSDTSWAINDLGDGQITTTIDNTKIQEYKLAYTRVLNELQLKNSLNNLCSLSMQENSSNTATDGGSRINLYGTRSSATTGEYAYILGGRENSSLNNKGYFSIGVSSNDGQTPVERLRINEAGNVGINTTNPIELLHIKGGSYPAIRIDDSTTAGSMYLMRDHSLNKNIIRCSGQFSVENPANYPRLVIDDSTMALNTTSGTSMFMNSTGIIGVGTTDPRYNLHVVSNNASSGWTGTQVGILITGTTYSRLVLESTNSTSGNRVGILESYAGAINLGSMNDTGTAWNKEKVMSWSLANYTTTLGGNLVPDTNNTKSIGISGTQFASGYFQNLYANGVAVTSDERLKTDIQPIDDALSIIQRMRPVEFKYRDGVTGIHTGYIAQECKNLYCEGWAGFVEDTDTDKTNLLRYTEFISLNSRAIQQLDNRLRESDTIIQSLIKKNEALETRLFELETRLNNN